jgi:hypothetical protein
MHNQEEYAEASVSYMIGISLRRAFWVIVLLGLFLSQDTLFTSSGRSSLPLIVKATRDALSLDKSMDKFGKQWFATKRLLDGGWIVPHSLKEAKMGQYVAWLCAGKEKDVESSVPE